LRRAVEIVRRKYLARPSTAKTFQAFEMCAMLDRSVEAISKGIQMSADNVHQAKSRKAALLVVQDSLG
jgi:hypothetical protein